MKTVLSLEDALGKILSYIPAPESECVSVPHSAGRFLASSPVSAINLPSFDNSAMDGYAVRSEDTRQASKEKPVGLRLVDRIEAGKVLDREISTGECVRIFTGSPMPRGADAVVMQEDTQVLPSRENEVQIFEAAKPWENVRLLGEDIRTGTQLAPAGELVTPALIAVLQASGIAETLVAKRPSVGVMATGSELVEAGNPLAAGKIYESNRSMIAALARRVGAATQLMPCVEDTLADTTAALENAFANSDVVITTGGVSVGEMDFVKPAFERLGGNLEFWKVAIKPGRPFVFGRLGKKLLMGLPGNPVSGFVTFLLLVRPALLKWQGANQLGLPVQFGTLAETIHNAGDRRHFVRVRIDDSGTVHLGGVQASHILSSMAAANALLDLQPGSNLTKGEIVKVLRY